MGQIVLGAVCFWLLATVSVLVSTILLIYFGVCDFRAGRLRAALPPQLPTYRAWVLADGSWCDADGSLVVDGTWRYWSCLPRVGVGAVPHVGPVEIVGTMERAWAGGLRDMEGRTVVTPAPGQAHIEVFGRDRNSVERVLAARYTLSNWMWLAFAGLVAATVLGAIGLSYMEFGMG